nr:nitrate regulatory gene2 protein-like [Quercus suber]XP_023887845.1 nitrate regulatory gene2 protein-like [Quercus suber]
MGCATSKLDDLPAVALCRDRCILLDEALRQSYALADAHVAYTQSLKNLGPILHHFFTQITVTDQSDRLEQPSRSSPHDRFSSSSDSNSNSNSNSHIESQSDSEPEEGVKEIDYFNQIHPSYRSHRQNLTPSPPPPTNSAWDFLNFFETYDRFEPIYDREEEEEEEKTEKEQNVPDFKLEVVKKTKKPENSKNVADKNVVSEKEKSETETETETQTQTQTPAVLVSEVMKEIQALFDKASGSGDEVLKSFHVGKFRYHQKIAVNQVSCKVLHAITPSLLNQTSESSPLVKKNGCDYVGSDEDMGFSSGNLSSSLEKLCTWEKKLYNEVKAAEKLRTIHEKKCRQLKRLEEKSAEAIKIEITKIETTRSLISTLSTKMNISIQVVDRISITINKLRNEELWQQINKLLPGLVGMWKAMLECHRCQCQAFEQGKSLDVITSNVKFSYAHLELAMELKFELQNWSLSFFKWIDTQKAHVKALNGWLLRCLLNEPEGTPDGIVPFSPSSIGAPPVFVICNRWSQAMDRVSEKEVIEAMQGFFISLNQLLEPHIVDLKQRSVADKDMERKLKILEREEQRIQKMVQAQEKKMGTVLPRSEIRNTSSLLSGLKQIFAALERFSANSLQAHEELCQHIQENRHV